MPTKITGKEREFHRRAAASSFNKAWDLLENKNRSKEEDRQMLNLAHASRYHWSLVGTPANCAAGDWQISRVYAALGDATMSMQFAMSSLEICEKNDLKELTCTAYEAIARAYATAKEFGKARASLAKAQRRLDGLKLDREGREIYAGQILDTRSLISDR